MTRSTSRSVMRLTGILSVLGGFVILAACATASSPDAWEMYRQQVADACTVAAGFNSPVVTGIAEDGAERTVICVVRKSPDGVLNAEISAGLDEWVAAPN